MPSTNNAGNQPPSLISTGNIQRFVLTIWQNHSCIMNLICHIKGGCCARQGGDMAFPEPSFYIQGPWIQKDVCYDIFLYCERREKRTNRIVRNWDLSDLIQLSSVYMACKANKMAKDTHQIVSTLSGFKYSKQGVYLVMVFSSFLYAIFSYLQYHFPNELFPI